MQANTSPKSYGTVLDRMCLSTFRDKHNGVSLAAKKLLHHLGSAYRRRAMMFPSWPRSDNEEEEKEGAM